MASLRFLNCKSLKTPDLDPSSRAMGKWFKPAAQSQAPNSRACASLPFCFINRSSVVCGLCKHSRTKAQVLCVYRTHTVPRKSSP